MYGGTSRKGQIPESSNGLSPRVRGNQTRGDPAERQRGSIPACTGEPRAGLWKGGNTEVYPRVYGGTPSAARLQQK